MKNTIGTAARKKRSAASVNGGTSWSATLIGTNVKPHTATTASVSAKSRGERWVFTKERYEE